MEDLPSYSGSKRSSTPSSFLKKFPPASKKASSLLFTKERVKTPCSPVAIVALLSPLSWPRPLKFLSSTESPVLDEIGFPDINQTAYQKGISCADAIFSTQEVLLNYIRQGESPFLCFYDIEKAFDSVEFPILLHHLFSIGINGKSWRLIKSWYQSPISCVKLNNNLSAPFSISRGVKQGSVLSPSLFLVIMNSFLQRMRNLNSGGSLHGTFTGSAVHADDVRSIAPSIQSLGMQNRYLLNGDTYST